MTLPVNTYYLKARLFPTILTSIPALILYNKFVSSTYHDKLQNMYSALPTITDVILSGAIVFLLVQINRFISKEMFEKLCFQDELNMPTTTLLLKSNTELDNIIKQKIENKIKDKFGITLLSSTEESANEKRARKLIVSTVSQIRNILRDNFMLLQHNIEYGFFRNLIGGSLLAFIFSIAIIIVSHFKIDIYFRNLGIILSCIYSIPLLLSKLFIKRFGKYYAKILYEQFMSV